MLLDFSTVTPIADLPTAPVIIKAEPYCTDYYRALFPDWDSLPDDIKQGLMGNNPLCQ